MRRVLGVLVLVLLGLFLGFVVTLVWPRPSGHPKASAELSEANRNE